MYFFDIVDYYGSKIIGNQYVKIPICDTNWSDMSSTARATRDAYLKALYQWYLCGTSCLEDGECKDAILAKWDEVQDDIDALYIASTNFWDMMGEECSTGGVYDQTIYQNYIDAQTTLQCDVEELTSLVDNPNPAPCLNCVEDVTIGTQVWGKCNANVSQYSDGTDIPEVTDPSEWANLTTGAWCYYNNDSDNGCIYGKLYNWFAVAGIYDEASLNNPLLRKQLAPVGYHIPTNGEVLTLTNYLGGELIAGGEMKESGTTHWNYVNVDATNNSDFTALPGGRRNEDDAEFNFVRSDGFWWTSTELDVQNSYIYKINHSDGKCTSGVYSYDYKNSGISVRFIKD